MLYDLVDPALELSDPCPDIHLLFIDFNDRFFEGALSRCEVKWSPRMYSCAGVCSYEGRSGMCSVRLSLPLLKLRPRKDLVETLLHEMIHAFLFVTKRDRDRDGHGPDFQYHMHRINRLANTKITIYHSFHDEVNLYKTHVWRCDGPCRDRKPFYGYVKRSSNRAPGPNDLWWNSHKASCTGTFQKIQEPDGYGQKKRKATNNENAVPEKKISPNSLHKYFTGSGQVLGTLTSSQTIGTPKSSRLLDLFSSDTAKGSSTVGNAAKNIQRQVPAISIASEDSKKTPTKKMPTPKKNISPNSLDRYFKSTSGSQVPTSSSQPAGTPEQQRPGSSVRESKGGKESFKDDVGKPVPTEIIDVELVAGPSWLLPGTSSIDGLGSATCPIEIAEDLEPSQHSSTSQPSAFLDETDQVNLSKHVYCPSCGDRVIEFYINEHLDLCIAAQ